MIPKQFIGTWTIDETSEWDPDYLHMMDTAQIVIPRKGPGSLRFGVVEAELDFEIDEWGRENILQFTFEGHDEGDPNSGRGSVKVEGATLVGHLAFHLGDRSSFTASWAAKP